jgi:arsenite methyltransferase
VTRNESPNSCINYGWDAPGVMLGMLGAGFSVVLLALLVLAFKPFPLAAESGAVAIFAGGVPLVLGLAMFQYGLAGKFRTRQAMLNLISWRGDEHVLDVGTGAGLLLVGAAKRLHRGGSAVGIDVWSGKDLSDNSEAAAQRNITLEGVANRANIDYGHFHHVEDETDPLNWFFYLLETGVLAGGSAFLLSSLTVGLINYRAGKDSK